MKNIFAALGMCAVLAACATATPYQPAVNATGGYENQQIETNRWSIAFSGNSLTDRQTVETYLLYRAAELTKQNGYDNFEIVTRETDARTRFISTGFSSPFFYNFSGFGPHGGFGRSRFSRAGFGRSSFGRSSFGRRGFNSFGRFGGGFHDPFFGGPNTFSERVNYEASAEIIMRRGPKPDDADYFDAEDVLINLSGQIILPET